MPSYCGGLSSIGGDCGDDDDDDDDKDSDDVCHLWLMPREKKEDNFMLYYLLFDAWDNAQEKIQLFDVISFHAIGW